LRLFFDNNISPKIARAVEALLGPSDQSVALRDRFDASVSDVEWLRALGNERGWTIVSGDKRILRNRAEREAFRRARLVGFFLEPAVQKAGVLGQAARLISIYPQIEQQTRLVQPPAAFRVPIKGVKLGQLRF
tara:strand:+ start:169 stop:567 length:399 start_codon:yes stop_codon:yes gene_type:complete